MRAMIFVLCLAASGCAAPDRSARTPAAPAVAPAAPATPIVWREGSAEEQERLRELPWFGEVNFVHMESYGEALRRRGYGWRRAPTGHVPTI